MAGNPCYLITITSDVNRNDIKLGKPSDVRTSNTTEPNTAKLKGSSGFNIGNATTISKVPSANDKDNLNANTTKSKEDTDKAEQLQNPYSDSSFNIPMRDTEDGRAKKKQVIFLTSRVHPGESNS